VSFLEALERNEIARLPGGIFSRAFVRSYAVEVGLDPEDAVRDFIAQFPHDSVTAGHPAAEKAEDREAVESSQQMATTFLRLALVSLPLAAVVAYFGIAGRKAAPLVLPPAAAAVPESVLPPAPAPASLLADTETATPQDTATAQDTATRTVATVARESTDQLTVTISVSRPCWVSATVDGLRAVAHVLRPGDLRTLTVHRELVLKAGDAAALAMTVNGAEAKPLGKSGEVVTANLTPANFKDFLPAQ
jgi:cytoskeletal protein RodZ